MRIESLFVSTATQTLTLERYDKATVGGFDPASPLELQMAEGIFMFTVTVKDKLGAVTQYNVSQELIVEKPPTEAVAEFFEGDPFAAAIGSGDPEAVLSVVQVREYIEFEELLRVGSLWGWRNSCFKSQVGMVL